MARSIITTAWSSVAPYVFAKRFGDLPESGNGGLGGQIPSAQAKVDYYVNWSDRWTFIQLVMGTPQAADYATPAALVYRTPLPYPDNPAMFAASFAMLAVPSPSGDVCSDPSEAENAYTYALVSVTFATPTYPMTGTDAFLTIDRASSAQEITAPNYSYKFSDGSRPEQPVGFQIPTQDFEITYHRVPYVDDSLFAGYIGLVNSATFLGFDLGTILCNPISSSTGITVGSLPLYEVVLSFSWRAVPWNQFLTASGTWDTLTDGSGNPVFASADMNDLIS